MSLLASDIKGHELKEATDWNDPGPYFPWREHIGRAAVARGKGFVFMGEVVTSLLKVHSLRPSDIKFVAAIGNGLLHGGPHSLRQVMLWDRGGDPGTSPQMGQSLQVTAGCQDHSLKLALSLVLSDAIRHFNPSVLKPICALGTGAVGRAAAEDLWIQAKDLVRNMKENQQLDFQNDWKLINVFFSNASQCHLCSSTQQQSHVTSSLDQLTRTLDYLQQEVPKAFVNLVDLSEALRGSHWHQKTLLSPTAQPCRCSGETSRLSNVVTQWAYQETWEHLLASSKYNEQESFVVVFQPFFYERALPPPSGEQPFQDPTALGLTLWNSMVRDGAEIRCSDKDPSDTVPTSVHRLKLADIKVIGALGDSLTAGNGAGSKPGNVLDVLTQYRGLSWRDLPVQARRLVDLMKNDKNINFQEDWKIITLFIGGNDLCDVCDDPVRYSPQNFVDNIGQALDILHAEVPRAFVNLVKVLEIINLRKLYQEKNVSCPRLILRNLCPCVLKYDDNATELASLIEVNKKYQEGTHQLVESGRYDTREDFTVVVQPFFEKVDMPMTPAWPFLSTYKNLVQDYGSQLLCSDRAPSASPPTSVHTLRPADIQVVAALGDSLTAGNGIGSKPNDLSDVTTQYRGLSYSSGGDSSLENVTTLPNILRKFNGNLTGYAVGTGDANETNAFLNQAVPGAKAEYAFCGGGSCWGTCKPSPDSDTEDEIRPWPGSFRGLNEFPRVVLFFGLLEIIKHFPPSVQRVNFHEDWKVITVLIGGNDLCDYCTDSNLYSADNFFDHLRNALDILHREVPRALVNLVDFLSPSIMRQVFLGNPDKCPVHQASILCNCVLTPRESSQELAKLESITRAYQSSMRELVESGRYETREDFSVVLQPFFYNIRLPVLADGRPDVSFFAPDCLHPSQKFHSQLSRALWINMLEPLGRKTDTLDLTADIPLSCPAQIEPFLRTPRNSNYTYTTTPAIENWGSDFLCTEQNPSNSVPTSVHELRPADIKVVAALGDSLTTAVGARPSNSSDLPTSWRGLSWSIGGDGDLGTHTTLPNILKKFNPNILGFSTGTQEETAGLNVAAEGARARDMPAQARDLVERMKTSPEINLQKDWKLITLFIGSNDLCHYCDNEEARSAEEYVKYIRQALDILYGQLPRAFINVVEVMELADLHQGQDGKCVMPLPAQSNCTCLQGFQENLPEMQELKTVNWDFQSALSTLSYQYLQREDFAVVVQPFFQNTLVPLNKLEPVGHKTTSNNFTYSRTKLKCPSAENPYLRTLRNSQLLQNQADTEPPVLSWAVPVAAGGGLVVGVGAVMTWRALRGRQKENSPLSLNTMSF
ncbi:hypothetical protein MJT46_003228 [Ovis ammon polii x Ovis aries]|nr:hypothetical protein MJT46_003228 [Ovis ammon polii x Ovis aries]